MSYQHKLGLVGSLYRRWQRIQLNTHIYTIQRCCYKQNLKHKHLELGIHRHLQVLSRKFSVKGGKAI